MHCISLLTSAGCLKIGRLIFGEASNQQFQFKLSKKIGLWGGAAFWAYQEESASVCCFGSSHLRAFLSCMRFWPGRMFENWKAEFWTNLSSTVSIQIFKKVSFVRGEGAFWAFKRSLQVNAALGAGKETEPHKITDFQLTFKNVACGNLLMRRAWS